MHGWGELATAPPADLDDWTRRHLHDLAALETQWLSAAEGKTLLHGDINQSNLLIDRAGTVVVIDWAQPVRGAAWIDVADLVPHLILAGHTPAAEAAITGVPSDRVPHQVVEEHHVAGVSQEQGALFDVDLRRYLVGQSEGPLGTKPRGHPKMPTRYVTQRAATRFTHVGHLDPDEQRERAQLVGVEVWTCDPVDVHGPVAPGNPRSSG